MVNVALLGSDESIPDKNILVLLDNFQLAANVTNYDSLNNIASCVKSTWEKQ